MELYAWTNNTVDENWPLIIYTDTENPTTSSKIYDSNGNQLDPHDFTSKLTIEMISANQNNITFYYGNSG